MTNLSPQTGLEQVAVLPATAGRASGKPAAAAPANAPGFREFPDVLGDVTDVDSAADAPASAEPDPDPASWMQSAPFPIAVEQPVAPPPPPPPPVEFGVAPAVEASEIPGDGADQVKLDAAAMAKATRAPGAVALAAGPGGDDSGDGTVTEVAALTAGLGATAPSRSRLSTDTEPRPLPATKGRTVEAGETRASRAVQGDRPTVQSVEAIAIAVAVAPVAPVVETRGEEAAPVAAEESRAPGVQNAAWKVDAGSIAFQARLAPHPAETTQAAAPEIATEPEAERQDQPAPAPKFEIMAAAPLQAAADAPAPAKRTEAPAPAAAPEPLAEPAPAISSPAREIRLEVAGGENRVELRLTERAGEVHVAVRTPNPHLAEQLRESLPALTSRLEQAGFRAEAWHGAREPGTGERPPGRNGERQQENSKEQQKSQTPKQKGKQFAWLMSSLR